MRETPAESQLQCSRLGLQYLPVRSELPADVTSSTLSRSPNERAQTNGKRAVVDDGDEIDAAAIEPLPHDAKPDVGLVLMIAG